MFDFVFNAIVIEFSIAWFLVRRGRGMLFYCSWKAVRVAAIPISRLRIASLVTLISEENSQSGKEETER